MKNYLLPSLFPTTLFGFSQNTFPYRANGNIGIGPNNPTSLLDVNGLVKSHNLITSDLPRVTSLAVWQKHPYDCQFHNQH